MVTNIYYIDWFAIDKYGITMYSYVINFWNCIHLYVYNLFSRCIHVLYSNVFCIQCALNNATIVGLVENSLCHSLMFLKRWFKDFITFGIFGFIFAALFFSMTNFHQHQYPLIVLKDINNKKLMWNTNIWSNLGYYYCYRL